MAGNGDKIEDLHQVRVGTRQMRAFYWVLRHDYKTSQIQKLKSLAGQMKQMGAALSYGRELDVSLEWAKKHHLNARPIQALRELESKKIRLFLERRGPNILNQLEAVTDLLSQQDHLPDPKATDHSLRKLIFKWQKAHPKSKKEFHRLRVALRNLIYIFKARRQQFPSKIGKLQKQLGLLHDFESFKKLKISIPSLKKKHHKLKMKILRSLPGAQKSLSKIHRVCLV